MGKKFQILSCSTFFVGILTSSSLLFISRGGGVQCNYVKFIRSTKENNLCHLNCHLNGQKLLVILQQKKGKLKTAISYRPNKNRTFSIQTQEGHGIKNCNGVFVIVFVII